jgi:hypothetical protein
MHNIAKFYHPISINCFIHRDEGLFIKHNNSTAYHIMPKPEKFDPQWGSVDSAATVLVEYQSKSKFMHASP